MKNLPLKLVDSFYKNNLDYRDKEDLPRELKKEGKDFIQIRGGPIPLDIVFAPDGIESYEDAKKRMKMIEGKFPCASIDDVILSKKASGRQRDKEELPRLESFRDELKKRGLV